MDKKYLKGKEDMRNKVLMKIKKMSRKSLSKEGERALKSLYNDLRKEHGAIDSPLVDDTTVHFYGGNISLDIDELYVDELINAIDIDKLPENSIIRDMVMELSDYRKEVTS